MKRKIPLLCLLIVFLLTNITFAAMPSITADRQYFDVNTGLQVLSGNVHIEHKGRTVTAGEAKTNMVEIWGSGGITFTQDDIYFSGDSVYVYFPNHLAQINGGVSFSRDGIKITADKVNFNWDTKIADFNGNVCVAQGNTTWTADSASYNVAANTFN
ncbi:MAG: LptA/OstA family protein [Veillonellales bacterium]